MDRDEEEFFYENEDPDNADEYLAEHLGHVCKAFFCWKVEFLKKRVEVSVPKLFSESFNICRKWFKIKLIKFPGG